MSKAALEEGLLSNAGLPSSNKSKHDPSVVPAAPTTQANHPESAVPVLSMDRDPRLHEPNSEFVEITEFRVPSIGIFTCCCVLATLSPTSGCSLLVCIFCPFDRRKTYKIIRRDELHVWPPPLFKVRDSFRMAKGIAPLRGDNE
eukprot:SAG31_NODE_22053_length_535_cov_0.708716_1_plen_143_part_01